MKNVCGLDVHKDSIFMCIIKKNGDKVEEKFGVLTPELDRLRDLLVYHSVGDVPIESTGGFWWLLFLEYDCQFGALLFWHLFCLILYRLNVYRMKHTSAMATVQHGLQPQRM